MSRLWISNREIDLDIEIGDGDDTLATLLRRIDRDFRDRGGAWLELRVLQDIADSGTGDLEADLMWCPAASTVFRATFDDRTGAEVAAELGILRPRDDD